MIKYIKVLKTEYKMNIDKIFNDKDLKKEDIKKLYTEETKNHIFSSTDIYDFFLAVSKNENLDSLKAFIELDLVKEPLTVDIIIKQMQYRKDFEECIDILSNTNGFKEKNDDTFCILSQLIKTNREHIAVKMIKNGFDPYFKFDNKSIIKILYTNKAYGDIADLLDKGFKISYEQINSFHEPKTLNDVNKLIDFAEEKENYLRMAKLILKEKNNSNNNDIQKNIYSAFILISLLNDKKTKASEIKELIGSNILKLNRNVFQDLLRQDIIKVLKEDREKLLFILEDKTLSNVIFLRALLIHLLKNETSEKMLNLFEENGHKLTHIFEEGAPLTLMTLIKDGNLSAFAYLKKYMPDEIIPENYYVTAEVIFKEYLQNNLINEEVLSNELFKKQKPLMREVFFNEYCINFTGQINFKNNENNYVMPNESLFSLACYLQDKSFVDEIINIRGFDIGRNIQTVLAGVNGQYNRVPAIFNKTVLFLKEIELFKSIDFDKYINLTHQKIDIAAQINTEYEKKELDSTLINDKQNKMKKRL